MTLLDLAQSACAAAGVDWETADDEERRRWVDVAHAVVKRLDDIDADDVDIIRLIHQRHDYA